MCVSLTCRAAGVLIGEGVSNFVTDWDKVSATVSACMKDRSILYNQWLSTLRQCLATSVLVHIHLSACILVQIEGDRASVHTCKCILLKHW